MKRILLILLVSLGVVFAKGQTPFTTPNLLTGGNTKITQNKGAGQFDSGLIVAPRFTDTATANLSVVSLYGGMLIRVLDTLWLRNEDATMWVKQKGVSSGSGIYVDTIYRLSGIDSFFFTINGATYAIKDSIDSDCFDAVYYVNTIAELEAYSGSATSLIVSDSLRGGVFNYYVSGLTTDNGVVFSATGKGSGYWKRQITESNGINVRWYGAKGDSSTIDRTLIQAAIDNTSLRGGGTVYFPTGTYLIDSSIVLKDGVNIAGENMYTSIIKVTKDSVNLITRYTTSLTYDSTSNVSISNLTIWGYADRNPSLAGNGVGARLIRVGNAYEINIDRVVAKYGREMGITTGGNLVRVTNCELMYIHRDGINVSDCKRAIITNNRGSYIQDDFIAAHVNNNTAGATVNYPAVYEPSIISNNEFFNSQGITLVGARNAIVANNTGRLIRARALAIGYDRASGEGFIDAFGIVISNNVFTDIINGGIIPGDPASGNGMQLAFPVAQTGTGADSIPVAPGTFDYTNKTWVIPDEYIDYFGSVKPHSGGFGVIVSNNVLQNTLSGLTYFTDAGFGQLWTKRGFVDTPFVGTICYSANETALSTFGIYVGGTVHSLNLNNNIIIGFTRGLTFDSSCKKSENILIHDNVFQRDKRGIVFASPALRTSIDADIYNNKFDLDPYAESLIRDINGGWTNVSDGAYAAVSSGLIDNIKIYNNTFKNTQKVVQKGASDKAYVYSNTYYGDPVNNYGMGEYFERNNNKIIWVNSDYQDASYDSVLSSFSQESLTMPTSGYYVKGQIVKRTILVPDANSSLLYGWLRLTDGSSHVDGTDWLALYTSSLPSIYNQFASAQTASLWISGQAKLGSTLTAGGSIIPETDNTVVVGTSAFRFSQIHGTRLSVGDGVSLENSAIAQFNSANRGILFPRLATTARNNVSSPISGLYLHDSTVRRLTMYNASTSGWNYYMREGAGGVNKDSLNSISTLTTHYLTAIDTSTNTLVKYTGSIPSVVGYTLQCVSSNLGAPSDGSIVYIGANAASARTSAGFNRVYIPKSGTIKKATVFFDNSGTLGTSETGTIAVRLNNTTDYTISSSVTNDATVTSYANDLTVPVTGSTGTTLGDYIEVKWTCPTWSTNPTNVRITILLYIE